MLKPVKPLGRFTPVIPKVWATKVLQVPAVITEIQKLRSSMYVFKCIYLYKNELTLVIGGGEFVKFFITLI